jgi:hypothetical protein
MGYQCKRIDFVCFRYNLLSVDVCANGFILVICIKPEYKACADLLVVVASLSGSRFVQVICRGYCDQALEACRHSPTEP